MNCFFYLLENLFSFLKKKLKLKKKLARGKRCVRSFFSAFVRKKPRGPGKTRGPAESGTRYCLFKHDVFDALGLQSREHVLGKTLCRFVFFLFSSEKNGGVREKREAPQSREHVTRTARRGRIGNTLYGYEHDDNDTPLYFATFVVNGTFSRSVFREANVPGSRTSATPLDRSRTARPLRRSEHLKRTRTAHGARKSHAQFSLV